MRLGEPREIVLMKIALADREQQRVTGAENGTMIKYKLQQHRKRQQKGG